MKKAFSILLTTVLLGWLGINKVLAQADDAYGQNELVDVNLSTRSVHDIVSGVINIFLGLLGVIAVILILYGGFIWMTSQGNAEKIQRAKMIIISAVIGLAIVLSAYAISRFVINSLVNATGADPGGPGGPGIPTCLEPADMTQIEICEIQPMAQGVGGAIRIVGWHFGEYGTDSIVNIGTEEATVASCGGEANWNDNVIIAQVPDMTDGYYDVEVDNLDRLPGYMNSFEVLAGPPGPSIFCLDPNEGPDGTVVNIEGVGFGDIEDTVNMTGWVGGEIEIDVPVVPGTWSDDLIQVTIPPQALYSHMTVDVGGMISNPYLFNVTCDNNDDCESDCCNYNSCRPDFVCTGAGGPYISFIDPPDGAAGNLVTIYGSNFGEDLGNVYFETDVDGVFTLGVLPSDIPGAGCSNYWTDTAIIIAVPDTARMGSGQVYVRTDDGQESNNHGFTRDLIVKPGICNLDPVEGAPTTLVTANGNNIEAGSRLLFGGVNSFDTVLDIPFRIDARVPYMEADDVAAQIELDGNLSNSFPFKVLPDAGGVPVISDISPSDGPSGEYITVMGANFGSNMGQLIFDNGFDEFNADFDFPPQCQGHTWQNSTIVAKVPVVTDLGNYDVRVIRDGDEMVSNDYPFAIVAGEPGPGLCLVDPDNGPGGNYIDLYGDNFGVDTGDVVFYNDQLSTPLDWNNNQALDTEIPFTAQTGPVKVRRDSDGAESNEIMFSFGGCTNDSECDAGEICCPDNFCAVTCTPEAVFCDYTWTITTESDFYIMDKGPMCDDSCTNGEVWLDFSQEVLADDLNNSHFFIHLCNNPDCTDWSPDNEINPGGVTQTEIVPGERYHVSLDHNPFLADNYYRVIVVDEVRDINGFELGNGPDNTWFFGVGEDTCVVESVTVSPAEATVAEDTTVDYLARAYSDEDICYPGGQSIICNADSGCEWSWLSTAPAVASILDEDVANNTAFDLHVGFTNIMATADQWGDLTSGSADLTVVPAQLQIIDHWPDCNGECYNLEVGVQFNIPITMDPSLFHIISTDDPGVELVTSVGLNPDSTIATLFHDEFLPDTEYQVTIEGTLLSESGDDLGEDYIWEFITGGEECQVSGVEVLPESQDLFAAGETASFSAFPFADSGVCGPIFVDCDDCTYGWSSSDDAVADIPGPDNLIDVEARATLISGSGWADISCIVNETYSDSGRVNVTIDTTDSYPAPTIVFIEPEFPPELQCTNAVLTIGFSELMDHGSLREGFKLYKWSTTDEGGCFPYGGGAWHCPVAASVIFDDSEDLDGDEDPETKAILRPVDLLEVGGTYYPMVFNTVTSNHGVPLNASWNIELGGVDAHYWNIIMADDAYVCAINSVTITPDIDWFTCAHHFCPDDVDPGILYNQHEYIANVFSIDGTELSDWGLTYTWSSLNTDLFTVNDTGNQTVLGTPANDNGETVLNVNVDGGADLGSGSANALINLFICEVPWPNPNEPLWQPFPWEEDTWNFSTYYCVDPGTEGSTPLPVIDLQQHDNHPDDVLVEYIASVEELLAYNKSSSPFGTLSRSDNLLKQKTWFNKITSIFTGDKVHGQGGAPKDIIGVRVMQNTEHLPIRDWYIKFAPHSTVEGTFFEVDGYEAYQVGNTVYISATNLDTDDFNLYTNVYIVAYNVGARPSTIAIASQLVDNILFNINIEDQGINICGEEIKWCTSDFDCPGHCSNEDILTPEECVLPHTWVADSCQAKGDKLRRDTKRLGHLLSIKDALEDYSESHKACSNNNTISCNTSDDCPGGECWQFYPLLNAGTFVDGMSTSAWPSWQQTLAPALLTSIFDDPINLFNGCPPGSDPETCWNETDLEFICPDKSLIYLYNVIPGGIDYDLGANFEYDQLADEILDFKTNLYNGLGEISGIDGVIPNIYSDLNDMITYCDASSIFSPGGSTSEYCGDSFVDPPEECDGDIREDMCSIMLSAPGYCTLHKYGNDQAACEADSYADWIPLTGGEEWWNEQSLGCYVPGSLAWICEDGGGLPMPFYTESDCTYNLGNWVYEIVECTWYEYQLTPEICGGFCGDHAIQPFYELCETDGFGNDDFGGVIYSCSGEDTPTCNENCMPVCSDGSLAAACGDGEWNPVNEDCDASAEPPHDGIYGWDCTDGGNITCTSSCTHYCDPAGDPYFGYCGDGVEDEGNEDCDPLNYGPISPDDSSIDVQYSCTDECDDTGGWCGDGVWQVDNFESCDYEPGNYNIGYDGEVPPPPPETSETKQYFCRDESGPYDRCTMTAGGWCGDGELQSDQGEECDIDNYDTPTPGESSEDRQYACNTSGANACLSSTGGYCGDGEVQDGNEDSWRYIHGGLYGEECDFASAGSDVCNDQCLYICQEDAEGYPDIPFTDDLLFGGAGSISLADGESSAFVLENGCRVSGDVRLNIATTGGDIGADNGVMFITDLSGSMQLCMNGDLPDGTCSGPGACSTYNDGNDTGTEPVINYNNCIDPAGPDCTWSWNNTCETIPSPSVSRINTVIDAIAGPDGALETIFDRDPDANVSLASFGAGGQLDADFGLDLAGLQTIVEGYEDRAYEWGTNHSGGLLQPMAIGGGDWGYDNKIVVFMTDGQYNPGADGIDEATTLRSNDFDVFSILLVPQDLPPLNINRLSAYMNGLSSSYCGCFNVGDPVGICGGSHGNRANNSVQCASEEAPNEYDYFEECDDGNLINGDGCDSNMQWEDTNKKRAYRAVDIDGVLNMYDAIAASLPVNDAQIRFIGGFDFMDDDGIFELPALSDVPTEVIIDSFNDLNEGGRCEENYPAPINVGFVVEFEAEPDVELVFSDAEYDYCPW